MRTSRTASLVMPFAMLLFALVLLVAPTARAEPPSAELMARLGEYAARFDALKTRASFLLDGRMETLDGDGKADSVKLLTGRVLVDGPKQRFEVVRYVEDGKDKTGEARKDAREREAKKKPDKKKEIKMPILLSEQARYVFDQVEVDKNDPLRVRLTFAPRTPEDDTIEGSAWVDTRTATLVSAGFKLSRTPIFVDYVHFQVEFQAPTQPIPAISRITVDGKGGILFFRKHFRARADLGEYRFAP
jgi:hypothetical protein